MQSVLIVDDHDENLYFLEVLLKGSGFAVRAAPNGAAALESALKDPPDLIVSDILMPVMDGYTLCREWRANDRLKGRPFIFYTATYTEKEDEELALSLGADRFVIKPQEPAVLLGIIREVLAGSGGGTAGNATAAPQSEGAFLKDYSEVLFRKLEKKMADLERVNRELQESERHARTLAEGLEQRVRERTAELERTNKELESFSYSVSHDLRAPLRAIDGFSGILAEEYGARLDDEGRRLIGVIRANSKRMTRLIDDLLAFSRTGRSAMKLGRLEMREMALAVLEEIAAAPAARARIDFTVGDLPAADGDAALVRQVWVNLLSNAVKFSSLKERSVIEVTGALDGNRSVYRVRDNGAGFDMQDAGKLFGVFQRLHPATEFEGTGIGLALVERIVARHGGRVWAEGAVDRGATFSFSLPAGQAGPAGAR